MIVLVKSWNNYSDSNSSFPTSTDTCPACPCELLVADGAVTCNVLAVNNGNDQNEGSKSWWRNISFDEHCEISKIVTDNADDIDTMEDELEEAGWEVREYDDNPPNTKNLQRFYLYRYEKEMADGATRSKYFLVKKLK